MVQATAPAKTSRSVLIGSVVVLLLLLIAGGSWALLHARASNADPRQQAIRFFEALKAQDWKTVYALSEGAERNFISEAAYESKMKETVGNPLASLFFAGLIGKAQTAVGSPTVHGSEATVPVTWSRTMTMEIDGKEYHQTSTDTTEMKMKKIRGVWKVADDPQGIGGLVALNYHFEISANGGTPGWQNIQLGGGQEPAGGQSSWQNGSIRPSTFPNSIPPRVDTGQISQPANATNGPGSPSPSVLEDRTRLGGPVDNSSANGSGAYNGYSGTPDTANNTNGTGSAPAPQGSSNGTMGNGSGSNGAPNTGEPGGSTPTPSGDDGSNDSN